MSSAIAAETSAGRQELPPHALQEAERRRDPSEEPAARRGRHDGRASRPRGAGPTRRRSPPTTPQCGAPSSKAGGRTSRLVPSIVTEPSAERRTSMVPSGIDGSRPAIAWRAVRGRATASVSRGLFRSANPIRKYDRTIVTPTATTIVDPSLARIVGSRSSGAAHVRLPEGVPHAVHGADESRLQAVLAELAADPGDVRIDHPSARVVAVAPHAVHQLVPAHHHAGVAGEREQDLELQRGEPDLVAVHGTRRRFGSISSPWPPSGPSDVPLVHPVHPAQDRLHAGGELAEAERLREVVVGADREPGDLVGLLGLGGEHQDRRPGHALDLLADLEPVHPRQHQVQDHEVGTMLGVEPDRPGSVARDEDREPLALEPGAHGLGDGFLVVDDEHGMVGHVGNRTRGVSRGILQGVENV